MDPFDTSISLDEKALEIFQYQKEHNEVYGKFCKALGVNEVSGINEIPLIPVKAFKDAVILTDHDEEDALPGLYFQSSGTTGMQRSRHYVKDPELYKRSVIQGMETFYDLDDYVILAYTPVYDSNPNSSLIHMLDILIERDGSGLSQYLPLNSSIQNCLINNIMENNKKIMLFGAAFGLLDLISVSHEKLPEESIILETGGMKTHRREMSREDLHHTLARGFGISDKHVYSEYGMTELLSQAYSQGTFWFEPVPWMHVSIRDPKDPMKEVSKGEEGLIGIIDLANKYSCSFILTGDKGIQNEEGFFQVKGRWNPKDLRGCNFLIDRD